MTNSFASPRRNRVAKRHHAGRHREARFSLGATYPSSILAALTIACLLTLSYAFSVQTVASVPVAYFLLLILMLSYGKSISLALAISGVLRAFVGFWLVWLIATMLRISFDINDYGSLALRDALITFSFAAVPLGAGIMIRHGIEDVTKAVKFILLVVASYAWIYPVTEVLPESIRSVISIQNVSVSSVVLIAGGMWLPGRFSKLFMILSGVMALFFTQSRTMYITAAVVVAVYVVTRSQGSERRSLSTASRVLVIGCFTGAVLVLLTVVGRLGVEGRVGAASIDQVVQLVRSLFDDSSELAGSRHARDEWWSAGMARILESPASVLIGSGLGPDLANGFVVDGQLVRKPHNDFLETAIRFGLPIGVVFSAFVVAAVVIGFRVRESRALFPVILTWILCAATNALGQPYFSYPHGAIPMAIAIGCVFVARPLLTRTDLMRPSNRRSWRPLR